MIHTTTVQTRHIAVRCNSMTLCVPLRRQRVSAPGAMLAVLCSLIIAALAVLPAALAIGYPSFADTDASGLPPAPPPSALGSLVHVQLLHRHGDRSPVHVAPAHATVWAKQGLRPGQLSDIGAAQLAAMGREFRQRYITESVLADTRTHSHDWPGLRPVLIADCMFVSLTLAKSVSSSAFPSSVLSELPFSLLSPAIP
jgi:hypothetical protein